jgi:hypothetical protein
MNGTAIRVKVEVFTDRQLAAVIAGGQQPATRMAQIEQARRAYGGDEFYEGPTCSLCDGLGHGYPGGGPCPLEERGEVGVPEWAQ